MDRQLDIENFERLLKEKSEEFKMYPTKRVWHSIYNNIHPGKKWPSIATCIVLIAILLLIGFLNTNDSISKSELAKQTNTPNTISSGLQKAENNSNQSFTKLNYLNYIFGNYSLNNIVSINNLKQLKEISSGINDNTQSPDILVFNSAKKSEEIFNVNNHFKEIKIPAFVKVSPGIKKLTITKDKVKNKENINFTDPGIFSNHLKMNTTQLYSIITTARENNIILKNKDNSADGDITADPNLLTENQNQEGILKIENKNIIHLSEAKKEKSSFTNKKIIKKVSGISTNLSNIEVQYTPLFISETDKAFIENYVLYNRLIPKKWAGKLAYQLYLTPSVVYRTLKDYKPNEPDINKVVTQHPSMGLEIGAGIIYPIFKGVKIKTGLQINYTRYNTEAFENSHPVSSLIALHDVSGQFYEVQRTTPFSNNGGITPINLHNDTYQFSIPIGSEIKLAGNDNIQWNIGATIQPTYVFGGKSYLLSSDKRNFIKETTFLNRFNLNAGFETFVSYKLNGFIFQFGPQFRKQIFTTNSKVVTIQEKLNNYGIRFGITKLIK